jgi:hypothetical protein
MTDSSSHKYSAMAQTFLGEYGTDALGMLDIQVYKNYWTTRWSMVSI